MVLCKSQTDQRNHSASSGWRRSVAPSASSVGLLAVMASLLFQSGCGLFGAAPEVHKPQPSVIHPPTRPADTHDVLGIVAYAASLQGKPYQTGGANPDEGFDCSGLVQHVFAKFNVPLPRSAPEMAASLAPISLTDLQAADLLFFNTEGAPFSHVGIYLGDGRFVHAPSSQTGRVIISKMSNEYWHTRLTAARRP